MKICALRSFASLVLTSLAVDHIAIAEDRQLNTAGTTRVAADTAATAEAKAVFVFGGVSYFQRWAQDDQCEFTPTGQENLEKWSDMITINVYPSAHDGDTLAMKANVLENYKSHGWRVLQTDSIPSHARPACRAFYRCCFGRSNSLEAAFPRFKLVDGIGCSIVYSHRLYREKVGDQMIE